MWELIRLKYSHNGFNHARRIAIPPLSLTLVSQRVFTLGSAQLFIAASSPRHDLSLPGSPAPTRTAGRAGSSKLLTTDCTFWGPASLLKPPGDHQKSSHHNNGRSALSPGNSKGPRGPVSGTAAKSHTLESTPSIAVDECSLKTRPGPRYICFREETTCRRPEVGGLGVCEVGEAAVTRHQPNPP